jgi:hypothetical protein
MDQSWVYSILLLRFAPAVNSACATEGKTRPMIFHNTAAGIVLDFWQGGATLLDCL